MKISPSPGRVSNRRAITIAVSLAVQSIIATPAWAGSSDSVTDSQRIEITGSRLPQLTEDTTSPVQVIDRETIAQSGAKTIKEALNLLVPNEAGMNEQGTSGFTAPGADTVAIGALGHNATLVLLNSRRAAPYPLAQDSSFVTNVNSLPLEAVERIEILRSGAASIYGSEAIQGVINIITRAGFEGAKLRLQHEYSEHSSLFHSSGAVLSLGHGKLDQDGFNLMSNIEVYDRDPVNWRQALPYINPQYFDKFPGLGSASSYSYPGNIIGSSPRPIAGCAPEQIIGGLCRYDRYQRFELIAPAQRVSAYNTINWRVSDTTSGFGELLLASTKTQYMAPYAPYGPSLGSAQWVTPTSGAINTFTYRGLPSGHPLNTLAEDELEFRYRFADANAGTDVATLQYRSLIGLRGLWNGYDWEGAVGVMGGHTRQRDRGTFSVSGFHQVVGNDDPTQTDPLFFNRAYQIGQANTRQTVNALFPDYGYDGKVRHYFADARLNGAIFDLAGGKGQFAIGGEVRRENQRITPTDNLANGDIVGAGMREIDDQRTVGSLFGELSLPVSKTLTLEAALRLDKYSRFDLHASPKIGFRYLPLPALTFRGTLETGFRAPNLLESANSLDVGFTGNLRDPIRCPPAQVLATDLRALASALPASDPQKLLLSTRADNVEFNECHGAVVVNRQGNPGLEPETAKRLNLGVVVHPVPAWNLSADYWNIRRRNEIGISDYIDLLVLEAQQAAGVINRRSLTGDTSFSAAELAAYGVSKGAIQSITTGYENGAASKLSGIDFALSGSIATPVGKVELSGQATRFLSHRTYNTDLGSYGPNTVGREPRWAGNLSANLATGDFTHTVTYRYVSGTRFYTTLDDVFYTPADCAARGWSKDQCRGGDTRNVDYSVSYRGIADLNLTLFVRNLLDRHNALSFYALDAGGAGLIPQGYTDAQGRVIGVIAEYRFR